MTTNSASRSQSGVRAAETRERLVEAAMDAFSDKGFHGTTTRDIASRAGVSPAAMYVHHDSKEELLYLISKRSHEAALGVVLGAISSADTPLEQLRNVMHDFALYHAHTHVASRVANYELAALSAEHLREILALRRAVTVAFRDLVDAGVAAGEFAPPDRQMAVAALTSMCVDISRWFRAGGIPPEIVARAYAEMAIRSIRG